MPDRSIRVSEGVWHRAKVAAAAAKETLSGYTEAALEARLRGVVPVDPPALATGSRHVEAVEWPTAPLDLHGAKQAYEAPFTYAKSTTSWCADEASRQPRASDAREAPVVRSTDQVTPPTEDESPLF